jgi:cyclase
VIKGIHLEGLRKVGNPLELCTSYYKAGVDEVLFMDAVASYYGRNNLFDVIDKASARTFVPMTIGGGLKSMEDIIHAFQSGADKVSLNTGLIRNPKMIVEISKKYGAQALVCSIEAKKTGSSWECYMENGREPTGRDVIDWILEAQDLGVGELLVTSVDQEGTKRGFDIDLYKKVRAVSKVPVIASGGAGTLVHIKELYEKTGVNGVALASVLHYGLLKVSDIRQALGIQ